MVRSESALSDKDCNFVKSVTALRLVGEGIEPLVEEGSLQYTEDIINQAKQEAGLRGKDVCGHCTTHNAVPCKSGNGICHYDKDGNCRFHDKSDTLKAFKICPKDICNRIVRIIKSRHRFHSPNFKNTDARRWFQNPFEIMKCFIPTDGYQDIETVEDTDCAGLLSVLINCKSFQSLVAADLGAPDNIFVKMREARNKMLHSAGFKITDRECQEHMQLMLSVLSDSMFLARDKDAKTAAEKIQEIADSSVRVYCGEEVQYSGLNPESSDSKDKIAREFLKGFEESRLFILRELSDDQKVMEPVLKSKSNKPKKSIVIVFAVKKKQADTSNVSRESNSKLTSGKTNGQTLKQGVQTRPVILQAMMDTTSNN